MSRRPSTPAPLDDVRELRKQLADAAKVARTYNVQQQLVCMPCHKPGSPIHEEVADTGRTHDNYEQMVTHPVASVRLRGDWGLDTECAICMELLIEEAGTPLPPGASTDVALRIESATDSADPSQSCGHVFHQLCVYQWCRSQYGTPKCPLCNLPIHLNIRTAASNRYARTPPMPGDVDEVPPPPPPAQPGGGGGGPPPAQPAQPANPANPPLGGRVRRGRMHTSGRQMQPGDPTPPEWLMNIPVVRFNLRNSVTAALTAFDSQNDTPLRDLDMRIVKELFKIAYRRQIAQKRMSIGSWPYPVYYANNVARVISHSGFEFRNWPQSTITALTSAWRTMVRPAVEQAAQDQYGTRPLRQENYINNQMERNHYTSACKLSADLFTGVGEEQVGLSHGEISDLGDMTNMQEYRDSLRKLLVIAEAPLTGAFDWNPPP
tara:strand:+ start:343 stop:1644 length:1302 start_codon:yes stop_codon:yes gene_type:complete